MIVGICLIFGILVFYFNKENKNNDVGKMTKERMIQIASKKLKEQYDLDTDKCHITYDKDNKIWNEYYAKYHSELNGHDFQAIRFSLPTNTTTMGGGPYWICIDRQCGKVLAIDIGI